MNKEKLLLKYKKVQNLFDNMKIDHISELSAQCSYYTMLSFVPFFILVLTLIQYTKIEPQTLFDLISKVVPDTMNDFVLSIIQEIYSKSFGTISISIIVTIWSAGNGLFQFTQGLQTIYNNDNRNDKSYIYLKIKSIIETILFVILIIVGLILLVFGNSLIQIIKEQFGVLMQYTLISSLITRIGFIFVTFIVFLLLYKYMAKQKISLKKQAFGAFIGAILLNIISFVFSKYLVIFSGFSITYGSLTTLVLIMMWIYSCFYAVFIGAEISKI